MQIAHRIVMLRKILKHLICFVTLHQRNQECRCRRCGRVVHRFRLPYEWVPEEGVDTSFGMQWNYQEVEYRVKKCRRCGYRQSERTQYRGIP